MAFNWLDKFHQQMAKTPNYAEKTLAAYRLGMKAKGSIAGIRIEHHEYCCDEVRQLPANKLYHPDSAPHLPLPACRQSHKCACVYRPVMSYEIDAEGASENKIEPSERGTE